MTICYIASVVEVPYRGGLGSGGSTHAYEVAKTLVEMGHQVHLLCKRSRPEQAGVELLDGIFVYRMFNWDSAAYQFLRKQSWVWKLARTLYYLFRSSLHTLKILRLARAQRFEVIYERSARSTLAGTWSASLLRIPLVLEVNDRDVSRAALKHARKIVTPEKSILASELQQKVIPLEWGVNTDLFHPGVEGAGVRREHGIGDQSVILFLGSGLPWHGLGDIVGAAERVVEREPNVVFLVVGGGPEINSWRQTIEQRGLHEWFRFPGAVEYASVPAYVASADIGLAPYNSKLAENGRHRFASPLKVLEYMAAAKPAIVTQVANARGTVENGVTGLVIPEDSPDALAAAILRLLENPEWRRTLGKNARRTVEANFSWKQHCSVLLDAFYEVSGTHPVREKRRVLGIHPADRSS
jgi:glycosyltransferase involved in cell wall biosynthesis